MKPKKDVSAIDVILRLKDVDQMFDLICAHNYFAGQFNNNIPVDDSRRVFAKIKQICSALTKEG